MTRSVEDLEEAQLLDLFFDNSSLFVSEQGLTYKHRLKTLISEKRRSFGPDVTARLIHLFTLVMSCPFLLTKPEGFEWILDEYIDVHHFSRLSIRWGLQSYSYEGTYHHVDKEVFRKAWRIAWGRLNRGRPQKPITNYGIAQDVERHLVEGQSFPDAIQRVAQERSRNRKDGKEVEVEEATIYRSLRKVGKRARARISVEETYYPGAGLVRPICTDLQSPEQKKAREEMFKVRPRGFPLRMKATGNDNSQA